MAGNILLQSVESQVWKFDGTTNRYLMRIGGVTVAWIDENGNLAIKGRVLKI